MDDRFPKELDLSSDEPILSSIKIAFIQNIGKPDPLRAEPLVFHQTPAWSHVESYKSSEWSGRLVNLGWFPRGTLMESLVDYALEVRVERVPVSSVGY